MDKLLHTVSITIACHLIFLWKFKERCHYFAALLCNIYCSREFLLVRIYTSVKITLNFCPKVVVFSLVSLVYSLMIQLLMIRNQIIVELGWQALTDSRFKNCVSSSHSIFAFQIGATKVEMKFFTNIEILSSIINSWFAKICGDFELLYSFEAFMSWKFFER